MEVSFPPRLKGSSVGLRALTPNHRRRRSSCFLLFQMFAGDVFVPERRWRLEAFSTTSIQRRWSPEPPPWASGSEEVSEVMCLIIEDVLSSSLNETMKQCLTPVTHFHRYRSGLFNVSWCFVDFLKRNDAERRQNASINSNSDKQLTQQKKLKIEKKTKKQIEIFSYWGQSETLGSAAQHVSTLSSSTCPPPPVHLHLSSSRLQTHSHSLAWILEKNINVSN